MRSATLKLALAVALLIPSLSFGQGANTLTLRFNGAPTGSCSPFMYAVNNLNGDFYDCLGGVWFLVATGTGSTAWSALTGGTNSNAGTFAATGNSWDFSAALSMKLPATTLFGLLTTSASGIKFSDGSTQTTAPPSHAVEEGPAGTINGVNVTFTLAHAPVPAKSLQLVLNGVTLHSGAGNDFTIAGNTITFNYAPVAGDSLICWYLY
jgi:hypothetical protein